MEWLITISITTIFVFIYGIYLMIKCIKEYRHCMIIREKHLFNANRMEEKSKEYSIRIPMTYFAIANDLKLAELAGDAARTYKRYAIQAVCAIVVSIIATIFVVTMI